MRLLRSVGKLEKRAAGEAVGALPAIGVVWSRHEVRVERALEPGEFVACDVWLDGLAAAVEERVTRDPRDLGWIYRAGVGVVLGRVVEIDGSLITYRLVPAPAPPEPGAAGAEAPAAVAALPRAAGGRAGEPQAAECELASAEPPRGAKTRL